MPVKPSFDATRQAYISLVFAGLMWSLPFLYFHYSKPLATFYQEWGAAALGLCAMFLLAMQRFWQQPEIPRIALLPIGLIPIVWVQFILGKVDYSDQALLFTLYMLWAALLIVLGRRLREELGMPVLATVLAAFVFLGAELNALMGVLQHYHWNSYFGSMIINKESAGVMGNIGQPNNFADYTTLGLISLGLLHVRWRLRIWQVALPAAPLLFVLALSGSRSPWLYLLCMATVSFLWQRRDKACLPLFYYCMALIPGFLLAHWAVQLHWLAGSAGTITSAERLFEQTTSASGSIRFYLWREAWLIFTRFPWLGAGFEQFSWQHFQMGPVLRNTGILDHYSHAHNLVMQIAAEMGLAGLVVLFGTAVPWLWQAIRNVRYTTCAWWACAVFTVLAIHSMLELPLWYANFMGVAALVLGMLDTTTYRLKLRGLAGCLSTAAILLAGVLFLSVAWWGYRNLENVVSTKPSSIRGDYFQYIRGTLKEMQGVRGLLLRPYIEFYLAEVDWKSSANPGNLAPNERVVRFEPTGAVVYRHALLLAAYEQQTEACMQVERAIWAYPDIFLVFLKPLRALVDSDANSSRFSSLLECALQKYDERQQAISTKP